MNVTINGEKPFQVLAHSFGVAATSNAYTLQYSVDAQNWTSWSAQTPANEVLFVFGVPKSSYFRLSGNTQNNVSVIY